MPQYTAQIFNVTTGGPYSYTVAVNGSVVTTVVGLATFSAAFDAAKAAIVVLYATETPRHLVVSLTTT